MSAISTDAAWRAVDTEKASLDLMVGTRFLSLDVGLTLQPGRAQSRSCDLDDNWADPLLGLCGRYEVTDAWFLTAAADLGGFGGSSDESWQAAATVGYQLGVHWSAQAGWRSMEVRKEIRGQFVEVDLNKPVLATACEFRLKLRVKKTWPCFSGLC
ncbi:hypothetical protein [Geminicoccus roseus]|uniref:hypothetical protein n=1 Tax=Geminicoccus roseus TaxID=404900 RepID=UPI000401D31D|nr:hypothetical protein [Geminicoccus roseus]